MLPVSRLITSIRYTMRDMQGAARSDFEIVEALNRASALLFEAFGRRFVHAGLKKTVLVADHGEAKLPADFHNVRKITADGAETSPVTGRPREGQYRIAGETFYAPDGAYGLEYWYIPAPVADLSDNLDAPLSVSPYLERAALALLNGDAEGAAAVCEACCTSLAAGEWSRFRDMGPVQVWGGKA